MGYSLIKTSVMMIGEFEYTDLFYGEDQAYYSTISFIIFVIFIVVMSIIIMNLLVSFSYFSLRKIKYLNYIVFQNVVFLSSLVLIGL